MNPLASPAPAQSWGRGQPAGTDAPIGGIRPGSMAGSRPCVNRKTSCPGYVISPGQLGDLARHRASQCCAVVMELTDGDASSALRALPGGEQMTRRPGLSCRRPVSRLMVLGCTRRLERPCRIWDSGAPGEIHRVRNPSRPLPAARLLCAASAGAAPVMCSACESASASRRCTWVSVAQ